MSPHVSVPSSTIFHPNLPPSRPSNPLTTATSPLLLIEPHHSFCKLTYRPVAILDAQAWYQEPQARGAVQQLEAPAACSQHHAYYTSPSKATSFPGPGFVPFVEPRTVDMNAQLPNAGALVDSFLSTPPQDTLFDSNNVELPTNSPVAPALSTLSAPAPQQGTPARAGRKRFECEDCHKNFDRPSRLDNCRNLHRGIRPWQCGGRCQDPTWFVMASSLIMWST